jgi:hypothetical protein
LNIDQIISKKLGLAITAMIVLSKCTDLKQAIPIAIVAIIGILAQTGLDMKK